MGKTAEDIRGKTIFELWPDENAALYHAQDLELMQHPNFHVSDSTIIDKYGKRRPVIFIKDVFYDESRKVARRART